jgi:restriction endonuclease S subunit
MLQEGDILLSVKGTIGKIGLVTSIDGEQWIASQSFVVIRLRRIGSHMDPLILSTYLRSWLGQESLNSIAGGATVSLLPMGPLRQLPIPLLSADAQNQIRDHLDEIRRLIRQRDEINERINAIQNRLVSDFFK